MPGLQYGNIEKRQESFADVPDEKTSARLANAGFVLEARTSCHYCGLEFCWQDLDNIKLVEKIHRKEGCGGQGAEHFDMRDASVGTTETWV